MPDIGMPPTRRFTVDPVQARHWLRHAVVAYAAYANGDEPPADLDGPRPEGNLPEIDDDWDPRGAGNEIDVYNLVRDAVDAGIIGAPTGAPIDGATERWDLEFVYVDDSDGGGYCFMVRLGLHLKLATWFQEMRKVGERDATGIPAAMAILTEAVTSANATLDALDEVVAARTPDPRERHAAGAER